MIKVYNFLIVYFLWITDFFLNEYFFTTKVLKGKQWTNWKWSGNKHLKGIKTDLYRKLWAKMVSCLALTALLWRHHSNINDYRYQQTSHCWTIKLLVLVHSTIRVHWYSVWYAWNICFPVSKLVFSSFWRIFNICISTIKK